MHFRRDSRIRFDGFGVALTLVLQLVASSVAVAQVHLANPFADRMVLQCELPVYFVQLPQWSSYAWTYLREEQRRAQSLPHTGMVVTIDLDNGNDIHPPNKIDVAERLASWPLAVGQRKRIRAQDRNQWADVS
ncbi:hypothetical protein NZK35_12225 [Stieleria sp. ICT_E10.1]|uniref:hypothetical protein n=1 Tax=Stieleria sedimenti TaxID=2976331 RepID=UPI0021808A1C|nr:hypothetical protein [Stieleria sedimenti]MCS7467412.1 hypothetical protein [Stieleria sedimenti]